MRLVSPFVCGGFGAKLFLRADALLAALGARAAKRPVKVAMQRALVPNNTTHRPATIQPRAGWARRPDGKLTAIGHEGLVRRTCLAARPTVRFSRRGCCTQAPTA